VAFPPVAAWLSASHHGEGEEEEEEANVRCLPALLGLGGDSSPAHKRLRVRAQERDFISVGAARFATRLRWVLFWGRAVGYTTTN